MNQLTASNRSLPLDIFRGMTICFMIIVNNNGVEELAFSPLKHAHWNGFTPTDLVFPSFLFAVGNAMSFAMKKFESMSTGAVVAKILKRTFLIFLLGYLMYWFPFVHHNPDGGWALKQKTFSPVVQDPGSTPNQCHVDVTHPADLEAPGRPIIVAFNDWAAVEHGWSLYRNDKNVQGDTQFTTRSWQLDWNGQEQSLVFTTMRKADGSPTKGANDTSQMIYETVKTQS